MKPAAVFQTLEEARELVRIADKALGYPKRGTQVGGGVHVPSPITWDGTGPTPPGWTKTHALPMKHPTRNEWCVEVEAIAQALSDQSVGLSPAERGALSAAVFAARALDDSWKGMRE